MKSLNLIGKDESYSNLYVDLVRKSGEIIDSYFWLRNEETFRLDETLAEIKSAASAAVSEFDKVVRIRKETKQKFQETSEHADSCVTAILSKRFEHINDFVFLFWLICD